VSSFRSYYHHTHLMLPAEELGEAWRRRCQRGGPVRRARWRGSDAWDSPGQPSRPWWFASRGALRRGRGRRRRAARPDRGDRSPRCTRRGRYRRRRSSSRRLYCQFRLRNTMVLTHSVPVWSVRRLWRTKLSPRTADRTSVPSVRAEERKPSLASSRLSWWLRALSRVRKLANETRLTRSCDDERVRWLKESGLTWYRRRGSRRWSRRRAATWLRDWVGRWRRSNPVALPNWSTRPDAYDWNVPFFKGRTNAQLRERAVSLRQAAARSLNVTETRTGTRRRAGARRRRGRWTRCSVAWEPSDRRSIRATRRRRRQGAYAKTSACAESVTWEQRASSLSWAPRKSVASGQRRSSPDCGEK